MMVCKHPINRDASLLESGRAHVQAINPWSDTGNISYVFNLSVETDIAGRWVFARNFFTETSTASKLLLRIRYPSALGRRLRIIRFADRKRFINAPLQVSGACRLAISSKLVAKDKLNTPLEAP
jgi:hypothetical protein